MRAAFSAWRMSLREDALYTDDSHKIGKATVDGNKLPAFFALGAEQDLGGGDESGDGCGG